VVSSPFLVIPKDIFLLNGIHPTSMDLQQVSKSFQGKTTNKRIRTLLAAANSSDQAETTFYLYGRDIPIVSIAEAIVLAVYIPPQAPAPGHEFRTTIFLCSSLIDPLTNSP
jgi:hypothetical protein